MKNSVVFRLSVKFSAILTAAVTIIILLFLMLLRQFSIKQEYNAFSRSTNNIIRSISTGNFRSLDRKLSELPFFVTCVIFSIQIFV